jgi:hypothetical protein
MLCIGWGCLGLVERLLIYRVKERRFCHIAHKKKCFGFCRITVVSNVDSLAEICPVYEQRLDELLNGRGERH